MYLGSTATISWWKNGTEVFWGDTALVMQAKNGNDINIFNGSTIIELAAGDSVGIKPRTGTNNIYWYGGHSCFYGFLIG
jgi:hypothetical protein